ncbi:MAG: Rne/Rng family ribonuclease [Pelagibacteraceae bacterium]|jgi:ribonuclease E|nr:Rne/Rng family ribonuclease [Pelagibacteraceae bacterium]MDP6709740.1 Rne/Rng family ribonuclease [Pelagibacteraceae bacterium]|tara:strand:- start:124 stop:1971 length:1848 start_codon:yes stop_codon:yes gene_type:complete
MEKNLYIDASHPDETRVVLKSKNHIEEYEYENKNKLNLKNNIYLGKVSRVEPSLQAAFVNYGRQRFGFLAFNDIQSDYYQIPHDDKEKLKKEEENLRIELKEKNKHVEEVNKSVGETTDLPSANENVIGKNFTKDKIKNENSSVEKNGQFDELKKRYGIRRYKIQEVIKPDQIVLVQILKEERGQKGAALTTFISLAGRYSVLMPNTPKGGGISRKISNADDKKKIRSILHEIKIPDSMGLIIRTASINKTKNELEKDISNTISTWEKIKDKAVKSIAPSLIYEEGDIIKRALRDIYDNETKHVIIEGNEGYQKAKSFMKILMPENVKKIKKYRGKIPLLHDAKIEKELNLIFEPTVKLESGGYMVINPTEALVSIDINSGQSIKEINIEKTALKTNLEAAEEISRQIKVRDISGLIVIDFIDMWNFYNRRLVEKKLREKLKDDRARIQFGRISNFGLLEMTRQRLRESSVKWNMTLSLDSFALKIVKKSEELAFSSKAKIINISIPEKVKIFIETNLAKDMNYFEKTYKLKFNLISDKNLILPEYKIELLNRNNKIIKKIENIDQYESSFMWQKFKKKEFKKKKFIGKNKLNKKFGHKPKTQRSSFDNKKSIGY